MLDMFPAGKRLGLRAISFSIFDAKNIVIFFIKIQYIPVMTYCIGKRKWYERRLAPEENE